ncbi:MAG: hypothetical protein D6791_00715 [Chloroflexi bacterium]|nr:MAG: hypothetical protein D6791_00715 [Chloroflexota bacterium]
MRRPDGVTLIAVWHFVVAGLCILGLCGMAVPLVAVWTGAGDAQGALVATIALLFGVAVILLFGGAFAIVGWGLWQLKEWARVGAIVLAILQLPGLPIGTVVGALTLWYLLSDPDAKAAFQPGQVPAE